MAAAVCLFVSGNGKCRSDRRHLSRVEPDSVPTDARTVLATAALNALLGGAAPALSADNAVLIRLRRRLGRRRGVRRG